MFYKNDLGTQQKYHQNSTHAYGQEWTLC